MPGGLTGLTGPGALEPAILVERKTDPDADDPLRHLLVERWFGQWTDSGLYWQRI